ncbi:MAG: hypothetical protein KC613_06965 [Myxococcales bacterium]|nr:hypothetical protein [Myxococcales bacterium]MCB9523024.1 hypothetical protein [Myxococcales bacterium]
MIRLSFKVFAGLALLLLLPACSKLTPSGAPALTVHAHGQKFVVRLTVGPKVLLESDSYKSRETAREGAKVIKEKYGPVKCNTTHRVVVQAKNNRLLGKSEPFANKAACQKNIDVVKAALDRAALP